MALRVLLLALVACLGFELPSVGEIDGWRESSRSWVSARMADLSSLQLEAGRVWNGTEDPTMAERVPAIGPVEVTSGRVDLAFEAAVEGMAQGFAADLASLGSRPAVEEVVAMVEAEAEVEVDPVSVVVESPAATASRLERISTAVRLTRQAVDAWASLIQPTVESDRGDAL